MLLEEFKDEIGYYERKEEIKKRANREALKLLELHKYSDPSAVPCRHDDVNKQAKVQ